MNSILYTGQMDGAETVTFVTIADCTAPNIYGRAYEVEIETQSEDFVEFEIAEFHSDDLDEGETITSHVSQWFSGEIRWAAE